MDGQVKHFTQAVNHSGTGERPDHSPPLPTHFQQIEAEQGKDLKLGEEFSLLINDANAVGIAIGG